MDLPNGLVLAGSFYQQLQNTTGVDLHLMDTLQRVDQALHQLNHQPQAQRLFTPVQQVSPQRLEERASEKRLGNFFNH